MGMLIRRGGTKNAQLAFSMTQAARAYYRRGASSSSRVNLAGFGRNQMEFSPSSSSTAFMYASLSSDCSYAGEDRNREDLPATQPEHGDLERRQQQQQQQHTIRWKTKHPEKDLVFTAYDGELLRTAALRRGLVSPHNGKANVVNCRGLGTCGTCAVEIMDESSSLSDRNPVEEFRLSAPPGHGNNSSKNGRTPLRLACQVQVKGDLVVTKRMGFWGQEDDLAEPSRPTKPFGKLEFVLDNKSPDISNES